MKNKQEQIEEMAKERNEIKDIMKILDKCVSLNPMCKAEVATVIYDNNYRKIPEDSVVLSREEYEKLTAPRLFIKPRELNQKELAEKLKNEKYGIIGVDESNIEIIPSRVEIEKETAEKILNELIDNSNKITFFDCRGALDLDKLAKQFGVEIKEDKNV